MPEPAPKVDARIAADVVGEVEKLMARPDYAPELIAGNVTDPLFGHAKGVAAAMIGIFGRLAELVIQRLNQVPEKNLLAYLDLLGNSLKPPQPARAPLTFSLSAGSAVDAVVPPRTQVAATPAEGESEPVIFETERELVVTGVRLSSVFVRIPDEDEYADLGSLISSESANGIAVFLGKQAIEHMLYIAHNSAFGLRGLTNVTVSFVLSNPGQPDLLNVLWERCDGDRWIEITRMVAGQPVRINTQATYLVGGGDIVFENLPPLGQCSVWNKQSRWLRCRLLSPITAATKKPFIASISLKVFAARKGVAIDKAFSNNAPVDVTKDFLPFGERPKPGDALYLAAGEAFSEPGAVVTVHVTIANAPLTIGAPVLKWEFWDGSTWFQLNPDSIPSDRSLDPQFSDTTIAFTKQGAGDVQFTLPLSNPPVATTVNGVEGFWIRVRLASGNYGVAAQYVPATGPDGATVRTKDGLLQYQLTPETYAPPSISSITVDYELNRNSIQPEAVLAYNDFVFEDFDNFAQGEFAPFHPTVDKRPTLYLGFTPPEGKTFPNKKISLFCGVDEIRYGERAVAIGAAEQPRLSWDYSSGAHWRDLQVRDESESLTRPGVVEFLGPPDFSRRAEFGRDAYWVRSVWDSGQYSLEPRLHSLLLNTVMAAHSLTVADETLGSSNGTPSQTLRTAHTPVLEVHRLEVQEPEMPSTSEHEKIKTELGEEMVVRRGQGPGHEQEIWVRWIPVADFYGSGPRDRHYTIENLSGEIRFGDGLNGMIPPTGSGNIKMSLYRSGGGVSGNRPAGTITQLKTTVPYVEKVTNYEAATGGADAETEDELIERAPRSIRHRGRAVTVEDYEDLARLASTAVARAKCLPLYDLEADPSAASTESGAVSLIIVPRSKDAKPLPSVGLIDRVRDFVSARKSPSARLSVVPPQYIRVDVAVQAAVTSLEGASEIELAIATALAQFLHPLTGGLDGKGWDFGRWPHKSDLYALIEGVRGVDHIRSLSATGIDDRTGKVIPEDGGGALDGSLFLVYSGTHTIALIFESP